MIDIYKATQWNMSELYRELASQLLRRELQKCNQQGQKAVYWDDLCEIARRLSEENQGWPKYEIAKPQAWAWIKDHRGEFSLEKSSNILATLIEAALLKEDTRRNTVAFIHSSFQSFFYAASMLYRSMSDFKEFIELHTGASIFLCYSSDSTWHDEFLAFSAP